MKHALISGGEQPYDLEGFIQYIWENADYNIVTLTGHNTMHSMGGIACVTPPGTRITSPIKCKVKVPPAKTVATFGQITVKTYIKSAVPGLESVVVDPLKIPDHELRPFSSSAATLDFLWVIGYVLELTPCPSWNGFMKVAMDSGHHQAERTRIEFLPFINLDSSNLSTIYTALSFSQSQCDKG